MKNLESIKTEEKVRNPNFCIKIIFNIIEMYYKCHFYFNAK